MSKQTKFIFITGGVVSSLGKGIAAASIGRLLKNRGLKVFMQKFDPYINCDPGTMSPYQHGEVYVTTDGAETDLDLGHYERFIDEELSKRSNITTGKVYLKVIENERAGKYNGGTVQVIPHITNEIKRQLTVAAEESQADVVITEIGGTVGDIESLPFLEAIRQARREFGYANTLFVHNTLVPYLRAAREIKTKPTQHSVKELRELGIQPDMIILRSEVKVPKEQRNKIALFCDVPDNCVFEAQDVDIIYEIACKLHDQHIDDLICEHFNLTTAPCNMTEWNEMIDRIRKSKEKLNIALVGKYTILHDAYKSVTESLSHAGYWYGNQINVTWVDSEKLTKDTLEATFANVSGIIVPGGFGSRGIEGMILSSEYARIHQIPYFGICLGMQIALVEIARNVLGYTDADSTEFNPDTTHPIVQYLPNQYDGIKIGGTLRLGSYACELKEDSKVYHEYDSKLIHERHRHRYEFNNDYEAALEKAGVEFVGKNPDGGFVEVVELKNHPWFVGCQFHPEFTSRPNKPNPLFKGFIREAIAFRNQKNTKK
jgi:CTP synthase